MNQTHSSQPTASPVVTWLVPGILLSIALMFALQAGKVEQGQWQATTSAIQNAGICAALLMTAAVSSHNARRTHSEIR